MITRENVRELAAFQAREHESCALSFYFQPQTPQNRSHREEAILAKDLVRKAMSEAEKQNTKNGHARADLERVLETIARWQGGQNKAKAIFACGAKNFWREFDLPAQLPATQVFVNRRFHLQPLAVLLGAQPKLCVALVDRQRGRLFDLRLDELREREGIFGALPRPRTDGYAGYDGGHVERQASQAVLQHFKAVAERLGDELNKGVWEKLILGCHDSHWHEFEQQLHPYVKQRLLGHFSCEVGTIRDDQIREQASRALREAQERRCQSLLAETLDQARSNSRGATGLRKVLRAFAMGEVQTLFLGEHYRAHAAECTHCGYLDAHLTRACGVCGQATRELEDVCEALIPAAIRQDIELFYVKENKEFDRVGNIAALLRFRADQTRAPQQPKAS
jgi:peptide subunit release factor 1 (eRF1)